MSLRNDIVISDDHRALLADGGVWVELPRKFEDIAYVKAECEKCEKTTFLKCVQDDGVSRLARCEALDGVKLFENMGTAPMPQVGALWEQYQREHAPKLPEVVEEPAPEPEPKKSFIDKLLRF